jgi:hypothetical protein
VHPIKIKVVLTKLPPINFCFKILNILLPDLSEAYETISFSFESLSNVVNF